jgi:predicted O-methyltransferase YrrM
MTIRRTEALSDALRYVQEVFTHDTPEMSAISGSLTEQERIMQLSPVEARLLQVIITLGNIKTIVEVGVLAGYSAIHMAQALPDGGRIFAIDRSSLKRAKENADRCGVGGRIQFYEGEAPAVLESLSPLGPFDMIFIDADKAGYPGYLDWAEHNIRSGGVIVADNTFLFGHVYQPSCPPEIADGTYRAMREFNQRLADPARYVSILVPTREGLTVAVKR